MRTENRGENGKELDPVPETLSEHYCEKWTILDMFRSSSIEIHMVLFSFLYDLLHSPSQFFFIFSLFCALSHERDPAEMYLMAVAFVLKIEHEEEN